MAKEFDVSPEPIKKKKKKVAEVVEQPKKKKKKKRTDLDDISEPSKKKKKKVMTDEEAELAMLVAKAEEAEDVEVKEYPVALSQKTKRTVSKLNQAEMMSIVGDNANQIQSLMEEGATDAATAMTFKALVQALVDLVPLVEDHIRNTKGSKGVYQLVQLISSIRELFADIQASQDRGLLGTHIVDAFIRPAMVDIGMAIVNEMGNLATNYSSLIRDEASRYMSEEDYEKFRVQAKEFASRLSEAQRTLGTEINTQFKDMREKTVSYLQR